MITRTLVRRSEQPYTSPEVKIAGPLSQSNGRLLSSTYVALQYYHSAGADGDHDSHSAKLINLRDDKDEGHLLVYR